MLSEERVKRGDTILYEGKQWEIICVCSHSVEVRGRTKCIKFEELNKSLDIDKNTCGKDNQI